MYQIIWLTGLPSSGKTTIAKALEKITDAEVLDGDELRSLLNNNDFSLKGRKRHMLTVAALANRMSKYTTVIVALVSPIRETREEIKALYPHVEEIFVKCSTDECIKRDVKGMYKKAIAGDIKDFTGISSPYEEPENAFIVDTENFSPVECVNSILNQYFRQEKFSLFIGRYQPLHDGHKKLIREVLKEGKKVCVALRDTPISESDPYTLHERKIMFHKEFGDDIKIISIPDIEDVCYGREVGWGIREIRLDSQTESISATKIRNAAKANKVHK